MPVLRADQIRVGVGQGVAFKNRTLSRIRAQSCWQADKRNVRRGYDSLKVLTVDVDVDVDRDVDMQCSVPVKTPQVTA